MTVLIFDGKSITTDRQGTSNGIRGDAQKLYSIDVTAESILLITHKMGLYRFVEPEEPTPLIFAICGTMTDSLKVLRFFKYPDKPMLKIERQGTGVNAVGMLLNTNDGMLYTVFNDYEVEVIPETLYAISHPGKPIALGAMYAGATGLEALMICAKLCTSVGGGYSQYFLDEETISKRHNNLLKIMEDSDGIVNTVIPFCN